ncbi:Uncharacterised protein [Burkholderia pseudomallei]|nr:Uncharacterised protein [Burkholderia pseudomallei]
MGGECRVESGPGTRAHRVKSTTWSAATLIYFSSFRDASPSAGVGAMAAKRDDARRDDGVGCGAGRHVGGASARRAGGFTILRFDSRTGVPALTDERIGGAAAHSKRVFADVCVSMSIVLPIRSTDSFHRFVRRGRGHGRAPASRRAGGDDVGPAVVARRSGGLDAGASRVARVAKRMTKSAMSTMKCAMTSLTPPRWRRRNALPRAFRVRRMKPRGFLPPESALSIRAASGFERAEPRRRMHSISTGNSNGGSRSNALDWN